MTSIRIDRLTSRPKPNHARKVKVDRPSPGERGDAKSTTMIAETADRFAHSDFLSDPSFEKIVDERVGIFVISEHRRHFQIQIGHFGKANPEATNRTALVRGRREKGKFL